MRAEPNYAHIPVVINGRKHVIVAVPTIYLPQFRTEQNKYTVFICGNWYPERKTLHATIPDAVAQAARLARQMDGAVFPFEPYLF